MKIAIIGYGIEGQAVASYFGKRGHEITILDRIRKTLVVRNPKFHVRFGPNYLSDLRTFDKIFRSPGIPYLHKEFDSIRPKLTSATKYFFEKCPCKILGVTGTKGKGTTASLIYEMAKNAGRRVFLGGNIGKPPLLFLDGLAPNDLVILELSSFQLQDLKQSPHIAVVLGITPDHLDHHKNMEEYVEAKKNIVASQTQKDFAVLDADNQRALLFAKETCGRVLTYSIKKSVSEGAFVKAGSFIIKRGKTGTIFGERGKTRLIGEHNIQNILAAASAASILNIPVEVITRAVREYPGLPHRLEFVRELAGVRFYNDSASTNPETAMAGIRAFSAPTILIAGGSDKNVDFTPLGEEIARRQNVKAVVLMGQTKAKIERTIEQAFKRGLSRRAAPMEIIAADSYQEAFMVAKMMSKPGDTVLLSPACASFDMFSNYQERGEVFRSFVLQS